MGWDSPTLFRNEVVIVPVGLVGKIPKPVSTNLPVRDADVFLRLAGARFMTVGATVRLVSAIGVIPEIISSPNEGTSLVQGCDDGRGIPHLWDRYPSISNLLSSESRPSKIMNSAT